MIDPTRICVIGAYTSKGFAYGLGSGMPWPSGALKEDMKRFKLITSSAPEGKKNLLIAGMSTFKTFPKPLPGRYLIGVSRQACEVKVLENGAIVAPSFEEALAYAEQLPDLHRVFFIGGKASWQAGLQHASELYITVVHKEAPDGQVVRLDQSLETMAKNAGFVMTGQGYVTDHWDEPVSLDFLSYFRDTK
jgi:dihydrofolate reductase